MSDRDAIDAQGRRLSLYHHLEAFVTGRRILEIGCGTGEAAAYLADRGAGAVLAVDTDGVAVERARSRYRRNNLSFRAVAAGAELTSVGGGFDLVLLPDAAALLRRPSGLAEARRALGPRGLLVAMVPSSDAGLLGGFSFHELKETLAAELPSVRLAGITPVAGTVVAEFDGIGEEPRIDAGLLGPDDERPTCYVAVAAAQDLPPLGRALIRLPLRTLAVAAAGSSPLLTVDDGAETRIAELRRRLDDALSQAESASRVARAQADEIAELRARGRRSIEDRALLEEQMSNMRRALAQADESVISLARRTAEGVDELASRLKVGSGTRVSAGEASSVSAAELAGLQQKLAEAEAGIAALQDAARQAEDASRAAEVVRDAAERERERATAEARRLQAALDGRDERIARLEGDRKEQSWRIAELEEKVRKSEELATAVRQTAARSSELDEVNAARERAIAEFHRAAARHVEEVNGLRATVADQAALVSELEENLGEAEERARQAQAEVSDLRRSISGMEESDRSRRQRLAELEGKLLRLQREQAEAAARSAPPSPAPAAAPVAPSPDLVAELQDLRQKLDQATGQVHVHEEEVWQVKERLVAAQERIGILENEKGNLESQLQAAQSVAPRAPEASAGALKAIESLESIESRLREEAETLEALEGAVNAMELHGGATPTAVGGPDVQTADELARLHTVIENFRRLAGRLRDEVDGFALRAAVSTPEEIEVMVDQLRHGLSDIEQG